MIGAGMALLALLQSPSIPVDPARADTPAASAPSAEAIPTDEVRQYAAIVGRQAVGKPVSGPFAEADKLLLLMRDNRGAVGVGASLGFSARQPLPPPPPGTLAVVRLHSRMTGVVPGPTAGDLSFVGVTKMPLYVIGEWARPAPMWEVAWVDDAVRFRSIGESGEIGPWQE